jgi:hypothetical protein
VGNELAEEVHYFAAKPAAQRATNHTDARLSSTLHAQRVVTNARLRTHLRW